LQPSATASSNAFMRLGSTTSLSHSRRRVDPQGSQRAANLPHPSKAEGTAAVGCRERVSVPSDHLREFVFPKASVRLFYCERVENQARQAPEFSLRASSRARLPWIVILSAAEK